MFSLTKIWWCATIQINKQLGIPRKRNYSSIQHTKIVLLLFSFSNCCSSLIIYCFFVVYSFLFFNVVSTPSPQAYYSCENVVSLIHFSLRTPNFRFIFCIVSSIIPFMHTPIVIIVTMRHQPQYRSYPTSSVYPPLLTCLLRSHLRR